MTQTNDKLDHGVTDHNPAIERNPTDAAVYRERGLDFYYKGDLSPASLDFFLGCW